MCSNGAPEEEVVRETSATDPVVKTILALIFLFSWDWVGFVFRAGGGGGWRSWMGWVVTWMEVVVVFVVGAGGVAVLSTRCWILLLVWW